MKSLQNCLTENEKTWSISQRPQNDAKMINTVCKSIGKI